MTSRRLSVILLSTWLAGSAVILQAQVKVPPERSSAGRVREPRLKLRTDAFRDGGRLPLQYTCWAEDDQIVSPALQWSYTPRGTESFTLMVTAPENVHQRGGLLPSFYWLRWNIPASTTEIPEGVPQGAELPDGSRQVKSEGIVGYNPPCAPPGVGELHYEFMLFALDTRLTLPSNATREDVLKAIDGHIVGASAYYGTMEREPE